MKTAFFPGSFDPFTLGHASVVTRALSLFDRVVIGIGANADKKNLFSAQERLQQVQECYQHDKRVDACIYDGLTVDAALQHQAQAIVRGVRSVADYEYERRMALVNDQLSAFPLCTVLLLAEPGLEACQSSVVRELIRYQKDVSRFVPTVILKHIVAHYPLQ